MQNYQERKDRFIAKIFKICCLLCMTPLRFVWFYLQVAGRRWDSSQPPPRPPSIKSEALPDVFPKSPQLEN